MRTLSLAVIAAVLGGSLGLADVITLDNGKSIRGEIVKREGGRVVILMKNGGRLTIPEKRVVLVRPEVPEPPKSLVERFLPKLPVKPPDKPAEDTSEETPEKTGDDGKPSAETTPEKPPKEGGEEKPKPAVEKPGPKLAARIAALVAEMGEEGHAGRATRTAAREALATIGEPALPALVEALEDASGWRRLSAAMVLGKIRSRKTVKALLLAVYLGTQPKGGNVAWWEKDYLDACADAFAAVAGSSYGYDAKSSTAGVAAEKMLLWWGENYEDYQPQVGDDPKAEKDPEDGEKPDPVKEIKKLPRRRYAAPKEMAGGRR
ncbi:MAG: HEAT repeat domain-containing protein [Planctomycetota bacterium]|jgi:hypothetical protein